MAEKVTIMVLKVDLQCSKCYKKVKKILCKFPQIRDQIFDEKSNTVAITVVCCNPEKIRDKLCCKGRGTIKSIDIIEPKKPGSNEPKSKPKEKVKKTDIVVVPPPDKPEEKKTDIVVVPPPDKPIEKKTDIVVVPPPDKPKEKKGFVPAPQGCPQYPAYYCLPYYDGPWHQPPPPPCHCGCGGRSGHAIVGPCHQPPPCHCGCGGRSGHAIVGPCHQPPPCHCGCGGRSGHQPPPCHCGCGGRSGRDAYGGGYCSNRSDYYISEENTSACTVM